MILGDTIAAVASGAASGPRSLLRLSGAQTRGVLEGLGIQASGRHRGVEAARIHIGGPETLPALVTYFEAPRSYTGEDAAEVMFPGGAAIRSRVVEAVLRQDGVRQAEPGEFTARAYLNGRMTAEQAEGVAAVIAAENERQHRAARDLLSGVTCAAYRAVADDLAQVLALVEAGIDFTDQEDVVAIAPAALHQRLGGLLARLEALLGPDGAPREGTATPVVVLAGPPNAGKSTLFNALLGRERVVVSPEPGTTRDAVEADLLPEPGERREWTDADRPPTPDRVRLFDLAGLDEHLALRSVVDEAGQRRAQDLIDQADVVVLCAPWGAAWPEAACREGTRVIRVRTKSDLSNGGDAAAGRGGEGERTSEGGGAARRPYAVCAIDGWGVPALRGAIFDAAFGAVSTGSASVPLWSRHRACLTRARAWLASAFAHVTPLVVHDRMDHAEVIASDLRSALDELGQVTGQISPDEVIGRVFATFCVGK